jgi:hypothetical protein
MLFVYVISVCLVTNRYCTICSKTMYQRLYCLYSEMVAMFIHVKNNVIIVNYCTDLVDV